jgi:hypothetical protein
MQEDHEKDGLRRLSKGNNRTKVATSFGGVTGSAMDRLRNESNCQVFFGQPLDGVVMMISMLVLVVIILIFIPIQRVTATCNHCCYNSSCR